ncbi:hypothetical protein GCM10011428_72230 [Streptomyces violaceus]
MVLALAAAGSVLAGPAGSASAVETTGRADLRADVNRDGRVDVTGDSDKWWEDSWSVGRGAVYLPNIDDDTKRCPVTGPGGRPLSDAKLAACNDGTDTKVNGTPRTPPTSPGSVPCPSPASPPTPRAA